MSGSDKTDSAARDGQDNSLSSTKADAILDKDSAHLESSATFADNREMNDSAASPAQGERNADLSRSDLDAALAHYHKGGQNADQPSIQLDATLEQALAHLQESATPADSDDMSEHERVTSLVQSELDAALARGREVSARLEQLLAHCLEGATPVHTLPPASMAYTRERVLTKDQSACPLFRLPPELRNAIYTYVFHSKYGLPQFQWDEEHDSPKLSLKCAQPRAPANELLRTCRSIYKESKGSFVEAKTLFWSDTTFTLTLPVDPRHNSFGYLDCLLDEQVSRMTRVNIHIDDLTPFTVHLRSGPDADSSVTCRAPSSACNHRSRLPDPLSFIERVDAIEKVQGQLSYRGVVEILWFGSSGLGSRWMHLCGECAKEPVVISVQNLSRAGIIAAVVWACDGPKCRTGG